MADDDVVWRRFGQQKCSVRVLHPQRYSDTLWDVLARLEGFLQCCVGCNAYLTPAASQVIVQRGWGGGRIGVCSILRLTVALPHVCHPPPIRTDFFCFQRAADMRTA